MQVPGTMYTVFYCLIISCSQPWYLGVVDFRADILSPMSVCISIVLEPSMCLLMCSTTYRNNEQFCWFVYHVALNRLSLNVLMRKVLDTADHLQHPSQLCHHDAKFRTIRHELMCCPKDMTLVVCVWGIENQRSWENQRSCFSGKVWYGNSITMLDCWTCIYPASQCILVILLLYFLLCFGFLDCIQAIWLKLFQVGLHKLEKIGNTCFLSVEFVIWAKNMSLYKIKQLRKSKHWGWPMISFCWWCNQRFVSQSPVLWFARPVVIGITILPKSDHSGYFPWRKSQCEKKAFLVAACEVLPQRNRRHSACVARVKTLLRLSHGSLSLWITQQLLYTVSGGKTMLPIQLLFSNLRIVRNLKRRTNVPGKLYGEIETKQFNTHKDSRRAIRKSQNS